MKNVLKMFSRRPSHGDLNDLQPPTYCLLRFVHIGDFSKREASDFLVASMDTSMDTFKWVLYLFKPAIFQFNSDF